MSDSPSTIIGRIASEFTDRQQRGENPSIEEYTQRYPELVELLRDVLPLLLAAAPRQETPSLMSAQITAPLDMPGYEILGELGRGGMGVVYKARQRSLGRLVALKMVLAGVHAEPQERARFLAEAELAARLHHPHIVHVYEMGDYQGQPYFAMEFVQGESLAARLSGQPLPPRAAAELIRTLALAVDHAHSQGIIHRDLKPANVLLDGDVPRIVDFGLARHQDRDSGLTASGDIVGTPSYMAPEQALGGSKKVGHPADIYALGAILYECLTGRPPFKAATVYDTLLQVATQDPVPPSRLNADVPRELETICLACLPKEPGKRYPSAQALADDLGRYLEGRPILARPATVWEHSLKWARRDPALAWVSTSFVLGTIVALCVVTWLWQSAVIAEGNARTSAGREKEARTEAEKTAEREAREKTRAITAEEQALGRLYLRNLSLAENHLRNGNVANAEVLLNECPLHLRGWEWRHLWERIRGLDADVLHSDVVTLEAVARQPGQGTLAIAGSNHITLYDPARRQLLRTLVGHAKTIRSLAYSPDGSWLASAGTRQDLGFGFVNGEVKLWEANTGKQRRTVPGMDCVVFRPDGLALACGGPGNAILIYDPVRGTQLARLTGHRATVRTIAFSPRGDLLVSADSSGSLYFWQQAGGGIPAAAASLLGQFPSPASGLLSPVAFLARASLPYRAMGQLQIHEADAERVVFDSSGARLATAGGDRIVRVWDVERRSRLAELQGHEGRVYALAWSASDEEVISGSLDGSIRVWDLTAGRERTILAGHHGQVVALATGNNGLIYSTGSDGTLRQWNLDQQAAVRSLRGHPRPIQSVVLHPQENRCLSLDEQGNIYNWDLKIGKWQLTGQHPQGYRLAFHPGGKLFASCGLDGSVLLWDYPARKLLRRLTGPPKTTGMVMSLAFHPNGNWLASGHPGEVKLWEVESGKEKSTWKMPPLNPTVPGLVFHDEGRRLTAAGTRGELRTWDTQTGKEVQTTPAAQVLPLALMIRPGSEVFVIGGMTPNRNPVLLLRSSEMGRPAFNLQGHSGPVSALACTPEGKMLASGSWDGTIRLWNPEKGEELLRLQTGTKSIYTIAFDRRGERLLCGGLDGVLRIFSAPAPEQRYVFRHTTSFTRGAVNRDAQLVAVGDLTQTVHIWDLKTGRIRNQWQAAEAVWCTAIDTKAVHTAAGLDNGLVQVWQTETGKEVARLQAGSQAVHALAFREDGLLACANDEGVIHLWRIGEKTPRTLQGHKAAIRRVAFSPDGKHLASAASDGTVRIWDVERGKEEQQLRGAGAFAGVAFSPDGKTLAAVGRDGTLHQWNLSGGRKMQPVQAHAGPALAVTFSLDGTQLVTSGEDRLIKIWDARTGKHLRTLLGHTHEVVSVTFAAKDLLLSTSYDRTVRVWELPNR